MVGQNKPFRHIAKTAGTEKKFTDFISQNSAETAAPVKNYEEEYVITHLAEINLLQGRRFNQSIRKNSENMVDTRSCDTSSQQNNPFTQLNFKTDNNCLQTNFNQSNRIGEKNYHYTKMDNEERQPERPENRCF